MGTAPEPRGDGVQGITDAEVAARGGMVLETARHWDYLNRLNPSVRLCYNFFPSSSSALDKPPGIAGSTHCVSIPHHPGVTWAVLCQSPQKYLLFIPLGAAGKRLRLRQPSKEGV